MTNRTVSVGLDVAKLDFEAAIISCDQQTPQPLSQKPFERSIKGVDALLKAIDNELEDLSETKVLIVMEATGDYSRQLAEWIIAVRPEARTSIVNPAFIKAYARSLGTRNKTDRADARVIARFGLERLPEPFTPATAMFKRLRALSRERDALTRQKVEVDNRSQAWFETPKEVRHAWKIITNTLKRQISHLEKAMFETVQADDEWSAHFARILTIPGVGKITALTLLAEAGDMRRFNRSRQLSAFAGTNPQNTASGTSIPERGRLCKMGRPRLRQALYLSTLVLTRRPQTALGRFYQRLVAAGKPKRVALCALMRKQLLIVRAVIINETPYVDKLACG